MVWRDPSRFLLRLHLHHSRRLLRLQRNCSAFCPQCVPPSASFCCRRSMPILAVLQLRVHVSRANLQCGERIQSPLCVDENLRRLDGSPHASQPKGCLEGRVRDEVGPRNRSFLLLLYLIAKSCKSGPTQGTTPPRPNRARRRPQTGLSSFSSAQHTAAIVAAASEPPLRWPA